MISNGRNDPRTTRKAKIEVIMSRALESFDDFSLKVVAVRAADDSDFEFEFPASGLQSTPSSMITPLQQFGQTPTAIRLWNTLERFMRE
jgi:hypothetical protein